MADSTVDLGDSLKSLPKKRVLYCPNPGNAGDSLIASATYQLFGDIGLQYETVAWDEGFDATGQVLIYGGGGNLTTRYYQARHFIERHHRAAERLVLLPHTVEGHADLLHQLGRNVEIFCREKRSFAWVREQTDGPRVHLADDLALSLDLSAFRTDARGMGGLFSEVSRGVVRAALKRYLNVDIGKEATRPLRSSARRGSMAIFNLVASMNGGTLHALRSDVESAGGAVPRDNVDLSEVFAYGTAPESVAYRATRALLSYLDRSDRVVTNRLHGCIPAAMLGKRVLFYANSYFKNKAIYEFSLRDQYPNVTWCGTWPDTIE